MRSIALGLICFLFCTVAYAAEPASPGRCDEDELDGEPLEVCSPARAAYRTALYDTDSLESLRASGTEGWRVFFTDGYDRDYPLVEAVLTPKGSVVGWTVPYGSIVPSRTKRSVKLDPETTEVLRRRVRLAMNAPKNPPRIRRGPDGEEEYLICGHSWKAVVETWSPGESRRRVVDTCDHDAAYDAAFGFGSDVVSLFPECMALKPENYRNVLQALFHCGQLTGERMAAASVVNAARAPAFSEPEAAAASITEHLEARARISWPGRPSAEGAEAVAKLWVEQADLIGAPGRPRRAEYSVWSAHGHDAAHVTLRGAYWLYDQQDHMAEFRQEWRRDARGRWRLRSWTFEPFVAVD
ncbi:MAG TPA: hypothetical protein VD929_01310 [Caulobacteraceae bacterium]|nr:hypothetical protein [Caulobacteraceae bacterium]